MTRITILVDDRTAREDIGEEHGLSLHIAREEASGLLDLGASGLFARNAKTLRVDLEEVEWILISHGHYDHAGGLETALRGARGARVYLHPDAFLPKYVRENGSDRVAGMPLTKHEIEQRTARLHAHLSWLELAPGVFATGTVPRRNDFEAVPARYLRDCRGEREHDVFEDDQSLVLQEKDGLILALGCCHAGVVNTLAHVRTKWPRERIKLVIGGMHLGNAPLARIAGTVAALKAEGVEQVAPLHCTGASATEALADAFGQKCLRLGAGETCQV